MVSEKMEGELTKTKKCMKLEPELASSTEEGLKKIEKRKMEKSKQMKRKYQVNTQKVHKNLCSVMNIQVKASEVNRSVGRTSCKEQEQDRR